MKPIFVSLCIAIVGIPLAYTAIKYFKLRFEYFKAKEKNDFLLIKKVFTPIFIHTDEVDERVRRINKLNSILWIYMILYGIFIITMGRYFLLSK